jgi:hypothetical protein
MALAALQLATVIALVGYVGGVNAFKKCLKNKKK